MSAGLVWPLGDAIWSARGSPPVAAGDLYLLPNHRDHDYLEQNQTTESPLMVEDDFEWKSPNLALSGGGIVGIVGIDGDYYDDYRDILDQLTGNFSNGTEGRLWVRKRSEQVAWRAIIVCLIMLVGILGNSSIIYSICANRQFRARATNIFILNMAIADLFTTILCPVIALIKNVYQFYVLGDFVCRCEGFIKITFLFLSSYALILLSLDWVLSIVKPCRKRISIRGAWMQMALVWAISLIVGIPLVVKRRLRTRIWDDVTETWCQEAIREPFMKYYWIFINMALIYIPTLCMTLALIEILIQMSHFEAKLKEHAKSIGVSPPNLEGIAIKLVYRRKIMQILFAYLLISFICWTPLQVTIMTRFLSQGSILNDWYFELIFFSELSVAFSAAMNPIIFGFLSRPYRNLSQLWKLLRQLDRLFKLAICTGSRSAQTNSSSYRAGPDFCKLDRHGQINRQHYHKQHNQQQQRPISARSYESGKPTASPLANWIYLKQVQQERERNHQGQAAVASAHLSRGLSSAPSPFMRRPPIARRRRRVPTEGDSLNLDLSRSRRALDSQKLAAKSMNE